MKNYLYIQPTVRIKEYKTTTLTLYFLYSPELLQQKFKQDEKQFAINETAIEIISLFNGLKTYNEIIKYLSDKYSESFQSIQDKVNPFIDQLINQYGYSIMEQEMPINHNIIITNYSNYYPSVASIEVTNICNINCRHCYGGYGSKENKKSIPLEDLYFTQLSHVKSDRYPLI